MPFKINLRLLNIFLFIGGIAVLCVELAIDITGYLGTSHSTPFQLLAWDIDSPSKLICVILASCGAATFFFMARRYDAIRKSKEDQYLASLIMFTMLYQGLGCVFELYYTFFKSDLYGFAKVVGRYYFPLEIVSAVIFTIVAFDVFLFPSLEHESRDRQSKLLFTMNIIATIIGVLMVFFLYISNIDTKVIIGVTGFSIYIVIVIVVIITCVRIFRLSSTISEPSNKRAVQIMGIQLLILMVALILFMLSEAGDFIYIDGETVTVLRAIKDGLYFALASLYWYSFIKPATSNKIEIEQ